MKRCPRCKKELDKRSFRRNKNRVDGLDGWCKYCRSESVNKQKAKQRKRKFYEKCNADYWKKYRKENFVKVRARELAKYNHKNKMVCSVEGCRSIGERHHPDYAKPLEIVWLCKKHHSNLRCV